jgi:pimeloyl-ACP methyl ester carboxylesterase
MDVTPHWEHRRAGPPVCGELDAVSPPAVNEANAAAIPNARVVQIPDCAHNIPWEKPEALREAVRSFLS